MKKNFVTAPLHIEETENAKNKENFTLEELIDRGYQQDLLPRHIIQLLADGANYSKDLTITDCALINSRLYYRNRLHVSNYYALCLLFCCLHHDSPHIGHLGIDNSYEQLHQNYY